MILNFISNLVRVKKCAYSRATVFLRLLLPIPYLLISMLPSLALFLGLNPSCQMRTICEPVQLGYRCLDFDSVVFLGKLVVYHVEGCLLCFEYFILS